MAFLCSVFKCITLLMTITYISNFAKLKHKLSVGETVFAIAENHNFLQSHLEIIIFKRSKDFQLIIKFDF